MLKHEAREKSLLRVATPLIVLGVLACVIYLIDWIAPTTEFVEEPTSVEVDVDRGLRLVVSYSDEGAIDLRLKSSDGVESVTISRSVRGVLLGGYAISPKGSLTWERVTSPDDLTVSKFNQ